MNCPWNDKLNALHDGELAGDAKRNAEAHVSSCAQCATELLRLKRTGDFLAAAEMPAMASDAMTRLRDRLGVERIVIVNGRRTIRLASWLTAAAAAVMVCCSVALYSTQAPSKMSRRVVRVGVDVPLTPDLPESDDPITLAVKGYDAREDGGE